MDQQNSERLNRRVLVIGLDGATLDLIRPWVEAGLLPNFRRLMAQGSWGELETIMPAVTPAAWSSFLTGMNPGKHGLYDFVTRKPDSYDLELVDASQRDGETIWKRLSRAGYRVTVFNVPITFPPEKVNGLMVSGLLTPASEADASWPPELLEELRREVPGFTLVHPGIYSQGQEREFVRAIKDYTDMTRRTTLYLMKRQEWDFMMSVFMSSDIISHFMWAYMMNGTPPDLANAIQDCYRDLDAALGEIVQEAGEDTYLVVMSDHGFGNLRDFFHINIWLAERGYLSFKRNLLTWLKRVLFRLGITPFNAYQMARTLNLGNRMRQTARKQPGWIRTVLKSVFLSFADVDWSRTQAYSVGFGGPIFVNLKGREPFGCVEPGTEFEAVLARIIEDLKCIRHPDTGELVVGKIYRREDLYRGARAGESADIIFMSRNNDIGGYGMHEFALNRWIAPSPDHTGTHRLNGILFLKGPGVKPGYEIQDASILDVMPTILALMGVPIPEEVDGKVLLEPMSETLRQHLTITYSSTDAMSEDRLPKPELSAEDEEEIRRRLRDLGYVA